MLWSLESQQQLYCLSDLQVHKYSKIAWRSGDLESPQYIEH
jgi:hypothetical protein